MSVTVQKVIEGRGIGGGRQNEEEGWDGHGNLQLTKLPSQPAPRLKKAGFLTFPAVNFQCL